MKRFSVIVCTYNRDSYLIQTLRSLVNQSFDKDDYEILVIDNNSTDNTSTISKDFIEVHPEMAIHYFLEKEQGISYARNRGILESKGEFIVFIDDDETIDTGYLELLDHYLNDYTKAELAATPVNPVYETKKPQWLSPYIARLFTGEYNKGNQVKTLLQKDAPGTGHAVIKKSLFEKYGKFNTELGRKGNSLMGAEDKDMFLRFMKNGVECYYFPEIPIYHHIPDNKLTDDFFLRITYALGKSERVRTQSISSTAYLKRLVLEWVKWMASFVLFAGYTISGSFSKGSKIIRFRWNTTRGLLGL